MARDSSGGRKSPSDLSDPPTVQYENQTKIVRERKQVVVDRELDAILDKHGTITTELILETAQDPSSKLHKFFDWDDSVAGQKWRRQQAYALVQASKYVAVLQTQENGPPTVLHGERVAVRRLVSSFRGEGFTMRPKALSDSDKRKAIIARKLSVLRGWVREAVDIPELKEICDLLKPMI